jgi:hypothetical protein
MRFQKNTPKTLRAGGFLGMSFITISGIPHDPVEVQKKISVPDP